MINIYPIINLMWSMYYLVKLSCCTKKIDFFLGKIKLISNPIKGLVQMNLLRELKHNSEKTENLHI
jgi:hypothetical protein